MNNPIFFWFLFKKTTTTTKNSDDIKRNTFIVPSYCFLKIEKK
jgi:hypothetical protein